MSIRILYLHIRCYLEGLTNAVHGKIGVQRIPWILRCPPNDAEVFMPHPIDGNLETECQVRSLDVQGEVNCFTSNDGAKTNYKMTAQ